MPKQGCEIGVVGLGTMGRNLALNFADHGFPVAVYNRTAEKTREFMAQEVGPRHIRPGYELQEFIRLLRRPRALLIMVAAGDAVDAVIKEIWPHLAAGDLVIDGGNSHFTDTNRRARALAVNKVMFMGLGVSGGEAGARYGPSLMPGGPRQAYDRVGPVLEAAAAQVDGEPCVAHLGPGSAGHYVKMVHNGIEYGLMELIAETYDLLKRGLGMQPEELHEVYADWNQGRAEFLPAGDHRPHFSEKGREDREAAHRPDPGPGQAKGDRHVDLLGSHGPAGGDSHHRHRRGDAGSLRLPG